MPAAPSSRIEKTRTRVTSRKLADTTQTISAVPRSGCFRISAAGMPIRMPGTISSRRPTGAFALRRARMRAKSRIIASFASSEGCRFSGPKSSQRCEPFTIRPETSTATSSAITPA